MLKARIANPKDFWAGIIFFALGTFVLTQVRHYDVGSVGSMGPGYYPMLLAIVLTLIGLATAVRALRVAGNAPIERWPLVPLAFLTLGVVAFAALIERAGLVIAELIMIAFICYGRWRKNPVEVVTLAVLLAVFTSVLFVYGIGLPISVFRF